MNAFSYESKHSHKPRNRPFYTALDCGAGVGRITEGLLLDRVSGAVDLLEPCAHLLQDLSDFNRAQDQSSQMFSQRQEPSL